MNLHIHPSHQFNELYDLESTSISLGSGTFADVSKCHRKSDSTPFAVKIVNKKYLTNAELYRLRDEIIILRQLDHPNIIKLIDVFDDGKQVYLVLELCAKQDLFEHILSAKGNRLSEHKAAQIIYRLSTALRYLHEHHVVHRDLKPENVLFGLDGNLKIADFGIAHAEKPKPSSSSSTTLASDSELCSSSSLQSLDSVCSDDRIRSYEQMRMKTLCGTPHYVAPEIIKDMQRDTRYTYKCDYWSLGVMLYVMLVGYQPFRADSVNGIYKLIALGKYDFESRRWRRVSEQAKDLVKGLLNTDPKQRLDWEQIQRHPWIRRHVDVSKQSESQSDSQ